jgi:hypothetical protein
MNTKQAKDFLVGQTVEQASVEGVPLSNLEKRMMYFTEFDDSCEDPIKLNDEFEALHDSEAYERKISRLLYHAYHRLREQNPTTKQMWDEAVQTLKSGDHYLLVMLRSAGPVLQRSTLDLLKLFPIVMRVAMIPLFVLIVWFKIEPWRTKLAAHFPPQSHPFAIALLVVGIWIFLFRRKLGRASKRFLEKYFGFSTEPR